MTKVDNPNKPKKTNVYFTELKHPNPYTADYQSAAIQRINTLKISNSQANVSH